MRTLFRLEDPNVHCALWEQKGDFERSNKTGCERRKPTLIPDGRVETRRRRTSSKDEQRGGELWPLPTGVLWPLSHPRWLLLVHPCPRQLPIAGPARIRLAVLSITTPLRVFHSFCLVSQLPAELIPLFIVPFLDTPGHPPIITLACAYLSVCSTVQK